MFVLILDTETTGLFPRGGDKRTPLNPSIQRGSGHCVVGSAPLPYAVQISYAIIDTSSPFFPIVEDYDAIIRINCVQRGPHTKRSYKKEVDLLPLSNASLVIFFVVKNPS